jgi:hypothetical protein
LKARSVGYILGFRDSAGVMAAFDLDALALQQGTEVTFHLADPGVMDDDRINHAVSVTPAGLLACTEHRGFGGSDK